MTSETVSLRENISPRTEKWIRISAVLAMIIVAGSSAVLSFDGLKKVALDAQIPEHLAFLFPIAVDTTILMGSLAVLLYELFGVRAVFGWVTVLFGTFLSIVGNVISVKDAGLIAQVLHGIIPVLLCISLESLLRILRFNIKRTRLARTPLPHLRNAEDDPTPVQSQTVSAELNKAQPESESRITPTVEVQLPDTSVTEVNLPSTPMTESAVKPAEPVYAPVPKVVPEPVAEASEPAPVAPPVVPQPKPEAEKPSESIKEEPVVPETVAKPAVAEAKAVVKPAKESTGTVEKYRIVLEAFPEDTPKARKVAEILRSYPSATAADIKTALGDPPELRIDGTMRRAKEWLKKN